jgi:ribosomal protein L37AE/L43A
MYIHLPATASADSRWRRWKCNGCGFTVEGSTSLYFMRKVWDGQHIAWHFEVAAYEPIETDPTFASL